MTTKFELTVRSGLYQDGMLTESASAIDGDNLYEQRQLRDAMVISSQECSNRHAMLALYNEGGLD